MNYCKKCENNYCCIVEGQSKCVAHCTRLRCDCIRCIVQERIRATETEHCQYCEEDACCYYTVYTGRLRGHNAYQIRWVCETHCPQEHCECLVCNQEHEPEHYSTNILSIPISHPWIRVRNGYSEAQAYVFEPGLDEATV
jgi:hypothetical protein